MKITTIWKQRVEGWWASGLTSEEYCEGKPFTAGGLRHYASRLREERLAGKKATAVQLAKVVRSQTTAAPSREIAPVTDTTTALVVEYGTARVAIRPGFDRGTLAAVLEVLATRGGAR
jgi:hypothetical protein